MQYRLRIRQRSHQMPRAARMIEMHVSEDDVVDRGSRNAQLIQRGEQIGNRMRRADIYECRSARFCSTMCAAARPGRTYSVSTALMP